MRPLIIMALTAVSCSAYVAHASDLSLVSALYKKSEEETSANTAVGNQKAEIGTSTIELGGRYGDMISQRLGWFGQALLAQRSYDAPSGVDEPSDSLSLRLGGGVRLIGKRWNEAAIPFLWALGEYRSEKTAALQGTVYSETEANGLFYSAGIGLRLAIDTDLFVDLENPLFESALFANVKTEVPGTGVNSGKITTEDTRSELYFKTYAPFEQLVVSLGLKL